MSKITDSRAYRYRSAGNGKVSVTTGMENKWMSWKSKVKLRLFRQCRGGY